MEASLAEISAERTRLASILDEANEQHRAEITTHKTRFETLQTRAATTEKLLEEAREHLAARADDIRAFDRRMIEASLVRNALESKLDEIEQAYAEREVQLTEVEQARSALAERSAVLTKAVMAREVALTRAEEASVGLNDRVASLEAALANTQQAAEQQIEDLHGELGREKLGRAVAEGALETARKDFAENPARIADAAGAPRRARREPALHAAEIRQRGLAITVPQRMSPGEGPAIFFASITPTPSPQAPGS